jgi:hypothetical protein
MFLNKAMSVADALMPIFNTPTGLPYALVNPLRFVNVKVLLKNLKIYFI